jgi:hypothetical protein
MESRARRGPKKKMKNGEGGWVCGKVNGKVHQTKTKREKEGIIVYQCKRCEFMMEYQI